PAPPAWYGLLPDMTYRWRVRVSDSSSFVDLADPSWSPWSAATLRTPKVDGRTIAAASPPNGVTATTTSPTLQWINSRTDVFYYEIQLSKGATFTTDPAAATAAVYWNLVHGGVS